MNQNNHTPAPETDTQSASLHCPAMGGLAARPVLQPSAAAREGGVPQAPAGTSGRMSYKFQRLREKLREAIRSGEFSGKLPGERALAKRFHVNAKTLSKALTDLAAEGLLDRSIGRGTYVKGTAPQSSAQGHWLVLCDGGQAYGCLVGRLKRANEHLQVVSGPAEMGKMRPSFLNQFDAVIDMGGETPEALLRDLVVRNVPVVVVGREPRTYSTHAVLADTSLAASRLARELLLAGHRRLAAVEAPGGRTVAQAIRQVAARYADAVVESLVPGEASSLGLPGDLAGSGNDTGRITAVVCDSAHSARELRAALENRSIRIPGDLCLAAVGCACESADCNSTGCGFPCSGYFVTCQQIVDAITNLLTEPPARPTTLWLAGDFLDAGTIRASDDDGAIGAAVVQPAADVASPMAPIGTHRLGTVPV